MSWTSPLGAPDSVPDGVDRLTPVGLGSRWRKHVLIRDASTEHGWRIDYLDTQVPDSSEWLPSSFQYHRGYARADGVTAEPAVEEPAVDAINPAHYQGFSNGAEVIDIVENLPYNRGAAVKYLARAGKKSIADELEDLEKAAWYVSREIAKIKTTRSEAV